LKTTLVKKQWFFTDVDDDAEWNGKKCKKYYGNQQGEENALDSLYVDAEGFPVGGEKGDTKYDFSYVKSAKLEDFVFGSEVHFRDSRVHDPPETTICPPDSESSGSKTGSKSESKSVSAKITPAIGVLTIILALAILF